MAAPLAWLIVAASAAVAIWLFLLKVRPPRVSVPSLLLWTRVLNESREQTLWERIRRAVSLALTAVIAAALALAFTQPSRQPRGGATGVTGRRVLLVVDSSWSMLARTRSGETRWDRAIAEARRLASAGSGVEIALATTADGLVAGPTADRALIDTALDRLAPAGSAGSGWPRLSGAEVHFLTDGAVARALDPGVVIHSVYEAAPNAGITAFDVRAPLDAASTDGAYLEVVNFGPAQQVHLTVNRGSTALLDRRVDMGAGEALHQVVRLPHGGAPDLHARIDADNDALSSDNDAFAWIQSAKPLTVAVVSDQPAWLAPWFAANADVHATFVASADYRSGDEDVVLFDRWAPQAAAAKPALYVAPPGTAWLGSPTQVELRPQWTTVGLHPLLEGVDPLSLSIDRARGYQPSALRAIARSGKGTPLVSIGDATERPRVVVFSFGPADSNMASAAAFPVLMGNALDWLGRPIAGGARRMGRVAFDGTIERITGPQNAAAPLLKLPGETVAGLYTPGLYTAEAGGSQAIVPVNVADPDVSNLSKTTLQTTPSTLLVGSAVSTRSWWIALVVLGFAAVSLEWWTWLRRVTV